MKFEDCSLSLKKKMEAAKDISVKLFHKIGEFS